MQPHHISSAIEVALSGKLTALQPVSSNWGIAIHRAELADGRCALVKSTQSGHTEQLALEAWMLQYLAANSPLPIPALYHSSDDLLIMQWIEGSSTLSTAHEHHAGELLAACHAVTQNKFGLERDTVIGALHQPNKLDDSWVRFFAEQRLLYMASMAHEAGKLPTRLFAQIEDLAGRLDHFIDEPEKPCLLHGDVWGGNVLPGSNGKIAAFIDPAIYYGHREIELAFTQMFSTFGKAFFESYAANAPFEWDFFELRCDLYNLYPTLVHLNLFGASYLASIQNTLARVSAC